jgi:hypothetical protein
VTFLPNVLGISTPKRLLTRLEVLPEGIQMIWIGIDNGVSGSMGIVNMKGTALYYHTPVKKELSYTKKKQWVSRIDVDKLLDYLRQTQATVDKDIKALLERPMVNPMRFKQSESALRSFEATLIVMELLKIPYEYIDSKEWQRALLPKKLQKDELKSASLSVGQRLFPSVDFAGFSDADGLLIAEYHRRKDADLLRAAQGSSKR